MAPPISPNKIITNPNISNAASYIPGLIKLLTGNDPDNYGQALVSLVILRQKGVRFTPSQEKTLSDIVGNSQLTYENGILKIAGSGFHLPNGAVLENGSVSLENGRWRISSGDKAAINGIEISYKDEKNNNARNIFMFFDGKEHNNIDRYVSINAKNKLLTLGLNIDLFSPIPEIGFNVSLLKNNPFIPIEDSDEVRIFLEQNTTIAIENRDSKGLIPFMSVSGVNSSARINNGWMRVNIWGSGGIRLSGGMDNGGSLSIKATGAPFEISILDDQNKPKRLNIDEFKGNTYVQRQTNGYTLVLNNYGEAGLWDLNEKPEAPINDFAPFIISNRLLENSKEYTQKDFAQSFPEIKLQGNIHSPNIKIAMDFLNTLPPKTLTSLKFIDFVENLNSTSGSTAAWTDFDIIHLKANILALSVFQHECAHVLTGAILAAAGDKNPLFFDSWNKIAGDVFGKNIIPENPEDARNVNVVWKDGSKEPKFGCVRAYGSKDIFEDIATFVETVWDDPGLFKPLLDTSSPQYDPRYKQKLDLLLEYGFIIKEKYDLAAGVQTANINTVQ